MQDFFHQQYHLMQEALCLFANQKLHGSRVLTEHGEQFMCSCLTFSDLGLFFRRSNVQQQCAKGRNHLSKLAIQRWLHQRRALRIPTDFQLWKKRCNRGVAWENSYPLIQVRNMEIHIVREKVRPCFNLNKTQYAIHWIRVNYNDSSS